MTSALEAIASTSTEAGRLHDQSAMHQGAPTIEATSSEDVGTATAAVTPTADDEKTAVTESDPADIDTSAGTPSTPDNAGSTDGVAEGAGTTTGARLDARPNALAASKIETLKVQFLIPVDTIHERSDGRPKNAKLVAMLAESIASRGLDSPIHVRRMPDQSCQVIFGAHRLAAFRQLGLEKIPCVVRTLDDLHAELTMLDENLCRAELGQAARARDSAKLKAIYEQLNPETVHGAALNSTHVANSATRAEKDRYTLDAAKRLGVSERAVQLDVDRGAKIRPEVLDMIDGTEADKGTNLDKLKRVSPDKQREMAEAMLAPKPPRAKAEAVTPEQKAHKQFEDLLGAWNVASNGVRADFLNHIGATVHV